MSDLSDVIIDHIDNYVSNLHTSFPATVVKYYADKQMVDVQPCLNKLFVNLVKFPMPVIYNVPIMFPSSGGASITFPVSEGDSVLINCCERSIEAWKQSDGGQVDSSDSRKFNLTDAIAIPGLLPSSKSLNSPTDKLVIKYKDASISIDENSKITIDCKSLEISGEITCKAINCQEINSTGDIKSKGDVSTLLTKLSTHQHTLVTAGKELSGPPGVA